MLSSKLLSQASATAEISLEIQRANSEKILELSQTITSMKGISAEASQASAQLQAILELIRGFTVNSSEIQQLTNSVNKLSSRIEGRSNKNYRVFELTTLQR